MSAPVNDVGIAGSMLPSRYVLDRLVDDAKRFGQAGPDLRRQAQLSRWWFRVAASCGPATGLRALFDLVAMPLFGLLGFRATGASFDKTIARASLLTRRASVVGLVVLPWATRPSLVWREVVSAAESMGASWCFLLAPPFVSLVDARGHATRRSVDFTLPEAITPGTFPRFWALASAPAFDAIDRATPADPARTRLDAIVLAASLHQDGVRADLQEGVTRALDALGGVMAARGPSALDEALTVVYRILFLLFAESRSLVPVQDPVYNPSYAVSALCRQAMAFDMTPGVWQGLAAISRLSRAGCRTRDLVVTPFNGRLFAKRSAPSLERRRTSSARRLGDSQDRAMRDALAALGSRPGPGGRDLITYRDLGVEELGAVYEHVLDLDPEDVTNGTRDHMSRARGTVRGGHSAARKQSGTFYTPRPLAEFVVRRTLAPLVVGRSSDDILRLRVVDPAMGSGAFLVAACRYLATACEGALIDEGRLSPADLDEEARTDIRRLVAERCLAGVDRNPVAVQLARLSLWLTTLARAKPLGFLDHQLRTGNSLVGASADDLGRVSDARRSRLTPTLPLLDGQVLELAMQRVVAPFGALRLRRDDSVRDVRVKEHTWEMLSSDASPLRRWKQAADLWCARWFWPADGDAPPSAAESRALLDATLKDDRTLQFRHVTARLATVARAAGAHGFFHWTLEFPDVFYEDGGRPKANPGFDAVIGNPPWEMLRRESEHMERQSSLIRFIRESGGYPSCDRGHVNLYQPFVERALALTKSGGQVGLVLPWSLASDDGAATLRRRLVESTRLNTLIGLDNGRGLFPIHRGLRFLALVASPGASTTEIRARFGVKEAGELDALPGLDREDGTTRFPVRLTPRQIRTIGGPSLRIPDARRPDMIALVERLAARFPALGSPAGWHAEFSRELNATDDRKHFSAEGIPVIEGKHVEPFVVRTADVATRIPRAALERVLPDRRFDRPRLAYRDVSGVGNRQSLIAAIIPPGIVTTHTIFCLRNPLPPDQQYLLCGLFNSFVVNAIVRLLMGGHVTTSLVEGLPVPSRTGGALEMRIAALAREIGAGGAPAASMAALQSAVAQLYEIRPAEFRNVLAGFPLVAIEEREAAARCLEAPGTGESLALRTS